MNIQKYLAFLKTVELNSLTKAARALGYSQSGISHMLNSLEEELNITLLLRDRSGVRITSEGLKVYPLIKDICTKYERLMFLADEIKGIESGLIRIGAFSSVATNWLPEILKSFQAEHPNIDFELLSGNYNHVENWVNEGRVDCGFIRLPAKYNLDSIFLDRDNLIVVMPRDHPFALFDKFPIKQLANERFILLDEGARNEITELFEKYKVKPKVRFYARDNYAILAMVESGLGISVVPELSLKRTPFKIVKKQLDNPAYRNLGVVIKDMNKAPAAMKSFLFHIKKSVVNLPNYDSNE